jgi:hypothetical protein
MLASTSYGTGRYHPVNAAHREKRDHKIDLLLINTEGYDYQVLKQRRFPPKALSRGEGNRKLRRTQPPSNSPSRLMGCLLIGEVEYPKMVMP